MPNFKVCLLLCPPPTKLMSDNEGRILENNPVIDIKLLTSESCSLLDTVFSLTPLRPPVMTPEHIVHFSSLIGQPRIKLPTGFSSLYILILFSSTFSERYTHVRLD